MPKKTVSIVLGAALPRFAKRLKAAIAAYLENPRDHLILISGSDWINDDRNQSYLKLIEACYKTLHNNIEIEDRANTTEQNAVFSKRYLEKLGAEIGKLNIFGDSTQMARTKRFFKREFKGLKLNFYAVPQSLSAVKDLPREVLSSAISLLPSIMGEITSEKLDNLRRKVKFK